MFAPAVGPTIAQVWRRGNLNGVWSLWILNCAVFGISLALYTECWWLGAMALCGLLIIPLTKSPLAAALGFLLGASWGAAAHLVMEVTDCSFEIQFLAIVLAAVSGICIHWASLDWEHWERDNL